MPKPAVEAEATIKNSKGGAREALAQPKTSELIQLCVAAWLIPGCGHYLLGKKGRAFILGGSILLMFLFGLFMKGEFYGLQSGSILESLGYVGEMCVGAARPVASFLGYAGGDPLFASADYGTAFLVAAGMLNVLTVFDAYDLAMGRKP